VSDDDFLEVRKLWNEAESALKGTELVRLAVVAATINELRCAGCHVLRALEAQSPSERAMAIRQAEGHCRRAKYDASDALLTYYLSQFRDFQSDYSKVRITTELIDYPALVDATSEAEDLADRTIDREAYHAEAFALSVRFRELLRRLPAARDELNKTKERHRRNTLVTLVSIGIALLGIVVALTIPFLFPNR
jgi:hypothetical protein